MKTATEHRTAAQNKRYYALVNQLKIDKETARMIVLQYSGARTEHTSELTKVEMQEVIGMLEQQTTGGRYTAKPKAQATGQDEASRDDRMRKRILSMCYEKGWTVWHPTKKRDVADMNALHTWCINYSYLHKALNAYSYSELPMLISQFEKVGL